MTGPLNESLHRANVVTNSPDRWQRIRAIAVAPDAHRGWRVDVDIDEDREPDEDPTHVRLALLTDDACFQVTLPVEVLRELAQRIGEL